MPIVRNGKVVAQVEREAIHESTIAAVNNKNLDSMNEILIVKKTPQEFNDLAYQIAKKGSSIFFPIILYRNPANNTFIL